jgi:hypothetical protein
LIGLSVRDRDLRFVGLNVAAAAMLGSPPEDYIGRTSREALGEVGEVVEDILAEVRGTGRFISTSLSGRLPTRAKPGEWVVKYLPMRGADRRIYAIAGFIVEVTAERELQRRLSCLDSADVSNPAVQRWADSLRDSLMVFEMFVDQGLTSLVSRKTAVTPVLHRVVALDERVGAVQDLVTAQTEFFPAA